MTSPNDDPILLIADKDVKNCESLQKVISTWGILFDYVTNSLKLLNYAQNKSCKLLLLDDKMINNSESELIPEFLEISPNTKIILLITNGDKSLAVKTLGQGAFSFLEKPIDPALLFHTINRVFEIQKTELRYNQIKSDMKRNREDLLAYKSQSERLNEQLVETNNALSVLARNIEMTQKETERAYIRKIRAVIIPIIESLQQDKNLKRYHPELTMLNAHIRDLTTGISSENKILDTLTTTELRIASLIKNGLKTEEIADYLYIWKWRRKNEVGGGRKV